jgi:hypothetical protein
VVVQHRLGASDYRAGLILPRKSNRIKAGQRGQQGISYRRSVRNCAAVIRYLERQFEMDQHAIDFRALLSPCAVAADCAGPGSPSKAISPPSHQTSTDRACRQEDAVQMQVEVIKHPGNSLKQSCDYYRHYDQNNAIN